MSVYKHSPTLISSSLRSSSSTYLLLVLAVSISQSQGVVAVSPPRNLPQAQDVARSKAVQEGFSNLLLELTSGPDKAQLNWGKISPELIQPYQAEPGSGTYCGPLALAEATQPYGSRLMLTMHPRANAAPRHRRSTFAELLEAALRAIGNQNNNQFDHSSGNGNNNNNNNNNNNGNQATTAKTTAAATTPRTTATPVQNITSATRQTAQPTTTKPPTGQVSASTPAPDSPPPSPGPNSESNGASVSGGENQSNGQPNGNSGTMNGNLPAGQQSGFTSQAPPNGWNSDGSPGQGGFTTLAPNGPGVGPVDQSSSNKGMVIGLAIGLTLLVLLGCCVAAFFIRRSRKRRREREQTSTTDDTAPWIWKREGKMAAATAGSEENEKEESRDTSIDRRTSFATSAFSHVRARTPGGSSAIPVPYEPSEVSDDMSTHFTLLPQDHQIGVPVPFPLALHVPSRVVHAMSERDERWRQYELQRQMQGRADDLSETSTIPRPPSRVPQRRSTLRSVTSSGTGPSDAYGGIESPRNSGRSTWEQPDYFGSEIERSQSEVAADEHRNSPLQRGPQSGRSSMISDFPTPPLPSMQLSHRRDGSASGIRRLPPLPVATRTSNDVFPFADPTENAENPFATEHQVNVVGMSNISERSSLSDEATDELTVTHHGEGSQRPVVGSVVGVARAASARNVQYFGRSPTTVSRASRNPFLDGPSRFSAADSVNTTDDRTIDSHQFHGIVSGFPTPPDPTRRL